MTKDSWEIVWFTHRISSEDKKLLHELLVSKVKVSVLSRILSWDKMSREWLSLEVWENNEFWAQKWFSEIVVEILAWHINDNDTLDEAGINIISQRIWAIIFQQIITSINTSKPLLEALDELWYTDIALSLRKALYFSKDFTFIIRYMVQQELNNINQSEFFYFSEEGKTSIAHLWQNEDEIVYAIEKMFIERFWDQTFDINNLLWLGLLWFTDDLLDKAKWEAIKLSEVTRI
jgi:hypothetical protein